MPNGRRYFGDDDGVQGFVGGGVGVARVKANYALSTGGSFLDDSDTVFAWQGLAGVRAPLSDHLDVTFKYRFFNADNVKRSEEHTSELQSLMRISYAVFCLKKKMH